MKTVFSTADVHPRDAYDYWHEVLCKKVLEHDCMPESRQAFQAELQAGTLSDIGLVLYKSTPMYCSASAHHVEHANAEELFVVRQVAGVIVVQQDSREVVLGSGRFHIGRSATTDDRKLLKGVEAADSQGSAATVGSPRW